MSDVTTRIPMRVLFSAPAILSSRRRPRCHVSRSPGLPVSPSHRLPVSLGRVAVLIGPSSAMLWPDFAFRVWNATAAAQLPFKLASTANGSVFVTLNNTRNYAVAPGVMVLPRLGPCSGCVAVVGEGRSLPCSGTGSIVDTVPIPAFGRRGYVVAASVGAAWDGIIADVQGLAFNASVAATQTIDLRRYIASVHPGVKISKFSVVAVSDPMLFSAKIAADGHTLGVSTPAGPSCGDATVLLAVTVTTVSTGAGGRPAAGPPLQLNLTVRKAGGDGPNGFLNPGFEEVSNATSTVPGWHVNTWNGDFTIAQPSGVGYSGGRCAVLHGLGAGKFGLYQTVALTPGTYAMHGLAASVELVPGQWAGTSSIYMSFEGAARPDFAPSDDTNGTHNLLSGSSAGWRPFNATFSVSAPVNVTVYWFIWGPGWLFVDDVTIEKLDCARPAADSLVVGDVIRPLNFTVPMTFEDTLLCGYCNDTAYPRYNSSAMCQLCAKTNISAIGPAPQAPDPRLVTSFAPNEHPPFFAPDASTWCRNSDGTATLFGGDYMVSNPAAVSAATPADWSHWSYLEIEVYNPSCQPVSFVVEIRDTATVDYWSRVNWYSVVPPGRANFTMPIVTDVGEKSQIGTRRKLDLTAVTRLALSNYAVDGTNLTLSWVRLLPETGWTNGFDKLLRVDMQPRTAPVFTSFSGFYPDTRYVDRRGYGFADDAVLASNYDREHPDDLWGDWISLTAGSIAFDLPPGDYGVWFVMEDAGYWEYFQNWEWRTVNVTGGHRRVAQTTTLAQWWDEYYLHQHDEDLPGESSWERYIRPRYADKANFLVATVPAAAPTSNVSSSLSIGFNCSGTFACTVSSLLIWPMAMNATATKFVAELQDRQKAQYDRSYYQLMPPQRGVAPPRSTNPSPSERLAFFSPAIDELVEANGNPLASEVLGANRTMNVTLAAGGIAPVYLCFVERGLGLPPLQLHSVAVTGTGRSVASVSVVRFKQRRITADGAVWSNQPRLLVPASPSGLPVPVSPNVTRCLWIELQGAASPVAVSINYSGKVLLSFGSSGTVELPLEVSELAAMLPSASPLWIGYLGALPLYPSTVWPAVRDKQLSEMDPSMARMAAFGFTATTGGAGGPDPSNESLADLSFAAIARHMPAGSPVNSYLGSAIVGINVRAPDGPGYPAEVAKTLDAVAAHATRAGWPPFIQTVGDEPQGPAVDDTLAVAAAFAAAAERLPKPALVGRTSVFTSVTNTSSDYTARLLAQNSTVELVVLNDHSADAVAMLRANGHSWMLYNGGSRFKAGFYLAMASHLHGCLGMYDFALSSVGADPYYALDAREDDLCAIFTTSTEGVLVTVLDAVQTLREGASDLRYCKLLRQLATDPSTRAKNPAAWAAAQQVLAEIDAIPLGSEHTPWTAGRIARVRRDAMSAIAALVQ